MTELVVRMVLSLSIVLGLLLLAARVAGKRYKTHTGSTVKVLQRQALSRGSTVTVVSVGNRVLVLGTTEQQVRVLTELDPSEIASPDALGALSPDGDADAADVNHGGSRLYAVPGAAAPTADTDFARVLLDAQETAAAPHQPAQPGRHSARHRAAPHATVSAPTAGGAQQGALAGSLLSPQTWRQALNALSGRAS